jgi:DNA-directed RNA polymerase subunit M
MKFCPKCGSVLLQKGKREICPRCRYSSREKIKIVASEKIGEKPEIMIISNKDAQVLPVVSAKCRNCGNDKAYFWTVQTRSGDEAETKFFKCTKCENTWREYR